MFSLATIQRMNNTAALRQDLLSQVKSPKPRKGKGPLTYNPDTWEVKDRQGKVQAFVGPRAMKAMKKLAKEKKA